jgi:RHH-type rel operon transcriptional repressor/antitoxin RelB
MKPTEACSPGLKLTLRSNAMLAIELPKELEDRLDALANRTGRAKSFYIKQAVSEYIDDLEDIYLAEQRLEDLRAGRSEAVPLEEVMREYGLEN